MLVANCETRQLLEASAGRGAVSDWLELIQFDVCQLVVVDVRVSEPQLETLGGVRYFERPLHRLGESWIGFVTAFRVAGDAVETVDGLKMSPLVVDQFCLNRESTGEVSGLGSSVLDRRRDGHELAAFGGIEQLSCRGLGADTPFQIVDRRAFRHVSDRQDDAIRSNRVTLASGRVTPAVLGRACSALGAR